jgi:alkylation response protein AidB-like acyl-CoA dehydrogenase
LRNDFGKADKEEAMIKTQEQELLIKMIQEMCEDKILPFAASIDETGVFPDDIKNLLIKQELFSLPFPEEYGGGGCDTITMCFAVEEMAKHCSNTALTVLTNELGATPILVAGNEEQKQKYMPRICSGKSFCSFGLTEAEAGSDVASIKTTAVVDGEGYRLNGTKQFISLADKADIFCIFASTDPEKGAKGLTAFIVDTKESSGLTVGRQENKMGFKGLHACEVFLEDVFVPKENILGKEGEGFKISMKTLDKTRPLVAGLSVGIAQSALDYAIEYCKQRVQFGRPISTFQGLQFMMADLAMQIEAARQLVYRACEMIDHNEPEITRFGAMAKCYATDVTMKVTVDAIQLMGGYGYMKEYPLERKMRDAKLLQIVEGTNQIQRVVIAGQLLK